MRKFFAWTIAIIIVALTVVAISFAESVAICFIASCLRIKIKFEIVMFFMTVFNLFLRQGSKS